MREKHSAAWEEIQPSIFVEGKRPKREHQRAAYDAEKWKAIHVKVDIAQHMEALSR